MAGVKIESLVAKSTNLQATDLLPVAEDNATFETKNVSGQQIKGYVLDNLGLNDLAEVVVTTPANGQLLQYNSTTSKWENVTPSVLGGDMLKSVYDTDNDGIVDSAEKEVLLVRNNSGSTIAKGKIVYINGAIGQKPTIALSDADTEATSSKTIGITLAAINNNSDGYIATSGMLHGFNTGSFTDGDALWLSSTAGDYQNTVPAEPAHSVFIGYVAYAHSVNGKIVLAIQNGYELNELHGVLVSSEANLDVLRYESSTGLWKNQQIETASSSQKGLLSSTDWNTFNGKQSSLGFTPENVSNKQTDLTASSTKYPTVDAVNTGLSSKQNTITLTTTGTSGIATLVGSTLNIPNYTYAPNIPNLFGHEIWRGNYFRNNSTTYDTSGGITNAISGTQAARSVATTNYATRVIRMGITASVVATGRYSGMRGSALLWYLTGGFRYQAEFNISDTAYASTCMNFWGLASSTSDLVIGGTSMVLPSTLTNIIAVASDSSDSNLQIMHNDGTGTATKIDLGANFPSNRTSGAASTTIYSITLYNPPASSTVYYKVLNKETGNVAEGSLTTNLPDSSTGLNYFGARTMGSGGGLTNSGQYDCYQLGVYSI